MILLFLSSFFTTIESGGLNTLLSHAASDLGPIDPYLSTPETEKQFSVPASV